MITVINAGSLSGYSQADHLIDDAGINQIIGKQFSTVKKALAAADKGVPPARSDSLCPYGAAFVSTDSAAPSGFLEVGR